MHARQLLQLGGSSRIHAGEERFSAPKKRRNLMMCFSAGHFAVNHAPRECSSKSRFSETSRRDRSLKRPRYPQTPAHEISANPCYGD